MVTEKDIVEKGIKDAKWYIQYYQDALSEIRTKLNIYEIRLEQINNESDEDVN